MTLSARTKMIREQQRNPGGRITAVMVSPAPATGKPSKYARLQYAALACGEFFRDELTFGDIESLSPRIAQHMKTLRETCFDALGDPSIADADAIRRKVSVESAIARH